MPFIAKYDDLCAKDCGQRIHPGDLVTWDSRPSILGRKLVHVMCDHPTGEVEGD